MKIRTILLIAVVSLFAFTIFANNSDWYLIGANVYNRAYYNDAFHTFISNQLHDAWFNAGVCTAIHDESAPADVIKMLTIMNNHDIDGILEDYQFYPNAVSPIYGARTLSGGNYYRFEAEYHDSTNISENDRTKQDSYFYMSSDADTARVGGTEGPITGFSNDYFWQVNNGEAGYAYHDLTYKWPKEDSLDVYNRVGQEFRFPYNGTGNTYFFDHNKLYITFAMQVSDIDTLADDTILADIRFTTKGETTGYQVSTDVQHFGPGNNEQDVTVTQITKEMYNNSPHDPNNFAIHLITCHIPFNFLRDSNAIIQHGGYWDNVLVNLNPTLYWWGHGTLKLDYIEFKDELYQDYTNNNTVLASMASNRTFGQPYLYGMNEPGPGQFESFRRISRFLEDIPGAPTLITPVHRYNKEVVRADGSHFSNRKAYYETVIPKVFMINEYPFTKLTSNPNWTEPASDRFVQKYYR